jgi:hypothetical protein
MYMPAMTVASKWQATQASLAMGSIWGPLAPICQMMTSSTSIADKTRKSILGLSTLGNSFNSSTMITVCTMITVYVFDFYLYYPACLS